VPTGPQRYPGASTAYWYQTNYPGDVQEVNVVVLHTTEGTSVPSYSGGSEAPNLTLLPDLDAKRLRAYQHFDFDRSSRALVNLSGGVETNTLNVAQVELVGTCDPATHARWARDGAEHIYWPEAPDWALQGVADLLAWAHKNHGVPLSGPKTWKAYPASYGSSNGVRMTFSEWGSFKGVCGHQHVPENLHGDPGSLPFAAILAAAKGGAVSDSEELDMTPEQVHNAVWGRDAIPSPETVSTHKTNPTWKAESYLPEIVDRISRLTDKVEALSDMVDALSKKA
jgi:hypothetical protein